MKKISFIILYLSGFMCFAQELSGVVTDGLNKQPIPGAKIELKELNLATYSKADGTFSFKGEWPDQLVLEVSMATYQTKNISITCCDFIELILEPDPHNMQEIMVRVERRELQGSATQKIDYIELDRLGVISPLTITAIFTLPFFHD